ncbi:hypothetical protein AAE02nite_09500 [Adhaeribacter aerolatus]|uniref:Lipoprotein n=1 Tax=Adhaeribacter aerolatus TaxID=670289 RepID=A0A512AUA0_9BACT|nr:hypothetical protein [Adhaeribacter aerolatus]GEO03286.1 hypothetical protein AAE02nite_09500 [Adhaeribacter aerolatus]
MKRTLILLGMASLALTACNHENTTTYNQNTATNTTATDHTTETNNRAAYQEQNQNSSPEMANSFTSKTATAAKEQQGYNNMENRADDVRNSSNYSQEANVRAGGKAAATSSRPNEMQIIDGEVNGELRNILNPEQYKAYESKPGDYLATGPTQDNVKREIKRDGDEITVKTGDIKVKAEPGKSKVETKSYESKIKGDERKYKSKTSDTKMKSEPGKAKYESGKTKIKVQED